MCVCRKHTYATDKSTQRTRAHIYVDTHWNRKHYKEHVDGNGRHSGEG